MIAVTRGAVHTAFDRVVITSISVDGRHVSFSGVDGALLHAEVGDPRGSPRPPLPSRCSPVTAATSWSGSAARPSWATSAWWSRAGRTSCSRRRGSWACASPTPRDPRWRVFETRLCAELLRTEGWALAGALVVADAIDTARRIRSGWS